MIRAYGAALSEDRCETECIHPEQVRPLLGRTLSGQAALRVGDLFGLLADPTRARILHALTLIDELCVCDLALLLGLSVSGLSHQLRLLRDRDAVARRKSGRIVYYRLADEHVRRLLTDALVHVGEGVAADVTDQTA
ncbi:MAG: ArsR/SmtB family transcription factor [Chloroflexota bacterium]